MALRHFKDDLVQLRMHGNKSRRGRGGLNMDYKFKTFGFSDTLKVSHTVQLPYKYYFISPANKTTRKKNSFRFEKCDSSEF